MPSLTALCSICTEPIKIFPTSAHPDKMAHRSCRQAAMEPLSAKPSHCAYCDEAFESKRRAASRGGKWIRCCSKSCARLHELARGAHQFQTKPRYGKWTAGGDLDQEFIRGELSRRKRRARLAGVKREPYTTALIAERDGHRCSLCGESVDMTLKFPHPGSASIDHIISISRGGDDTLANVALACLRCNLSKGAGDGSKEIASCA